MRETFEEFIQDKHMEQYVGTKDGCVEDFEDWIAELSVDEWLDFGNRYRHAELFSFAKKIDSIINEEDKK